MVARVSCHPTGQAFPSESGARTSAACKEEILFYFNAGCWAPKEITSFSSSPPLREHSVPIQRAWNTNTSNVLMERT